MSERNVDSRILLEVCVDGVAGIDAAVAGGADRIELCSALSVGGLTPSFGLMRRAALSPVPVYAMIRPRAGDFVFSPDEVGIMLADIDAARRAGLAGVVLGASHDNGDLDVATLQRLVQQAEGLGTTLHRAIDLVRDPVEAVSMAVDLGFERILTSGGGATALEGIETLLRMQEEAAGRISIMPGSGLSLQTLDQILPRLQPQEVHASCSMSGPAQNIRAVALGFTTDVTRSTNRQTVAAMKDRLSRQIG